MNTYIEANKQAWATLAEEHYQHYKTHHLSHEITLNAIQIQELGDITGKTLIHLQCNTGADTISLARLGAKVTGVDLVPDNIRCARQLAADCGIADARFIQSNVLEIMDQHDERYDIVYTTEGVLCWLPDLYLWARNVHHLLADDGFLYVMDGHPFFMTWDEARLPELVIKYPYFRKSADQEEWIGGYACEPKSAVNYGWMYTVGEIITALSQAGLHIEWFHEFDWVYYKLSAEKQIKDEQGNWVYREYQGKLPFTFSLRATIR